MGERVEVTPPVADEGWLRVLHRNRFWLILSLAVLLALIGLVYVLVHLSSADSEMYPTSATCNLSYNRLS